MNVFKVSDIVEFAIRIEEMGKISTATPYNLRPMKS